VMEHELQRAGGEAAPAEGGEEFVADVHLVVSEPGVVTVAVVIDPSRELAFRDDAEGWLRLVAANAEEPPPLVVSARDKGGDVQDGRRRAMLRSLLVLGMS
jgi:hypothetical protein